ncbi:FN3 associated domain-containing protein [Niabella ginsengisoli]|uniref:Chitobiase/beta-hexosaminidase C-terminal domain-containing protein n=1 Tax=Niabella ginsengisoli TaxID=522298 RepID=A0ABS9SNI3_9BACT|nr:FN3 associated domain-containing protein [Niabella ginsengisoli]MCH5599963.1 chitobiase/beta-hexosaminidase C-terminal domain-containing protein [Niabella ginsengisoli]
MRAGWFYRNDTEQNVRSADDIFDIYERSVGGNSIFLLNIPPNRKGQFSDRDINALLEAGKRIKETYGNNLFKNANGEQKVLDNNIASYKLLGKDGGELIISTPSAVTINRIVLQEAISTHSERVEKHAVDAWIEGSWKEIAQATNIGYKRILRFPEVTSDKFRIRVTQVRYAPAISNVAAFYYTARPPQLQVTTDVNGLVSIGIKEDGFSWHYWKSGDKSIEAYLNSGVKIYYTTDGSKPTESSSLYTKPFEMHKGEVKAVAFTKTDKGSMVSEKIGIPKLTWKLIATSTESEKIKRRLLLMLTTILFGPVIQQAATSLFQLIWGKLYAETICLHAANIQRQRHDGKRNAIHE